MVAFDCVLRTDVQSGKQKNFKGQFVAADLKVKFISYENDYIHFSLI